MTGFCVLETDNSNCVCEIHEVLIPFFRTVCPKTENGGAVCIDVSALSQIDFSKLVYHSDLTIDGLCDESDNCKTAGHVEEGLLC